jgi:hypothetical protein
MQEMLQRIYADGNTLHVSIEAYSQKRVQLQKRLSVDIKKMLNGQIDQLRRSAEEEGKQAAEFLDSPLGQMDHNHTQDLLVDLILTMNLAFQGDYNFESCSPSSFRLIRDPTHFVKEINSTVLSKLDSYQQQSIDRDGAGGDSAASNNNNGRQSSGVQEPFSQRFWSALNRSIAVDDCQVFSYVPSGDDEAVELGSAGALNFFFYNTTKKKMVFFNCYHVSCLLANQDDMMMTDGSGGNGGESHQRSESPPSFFTLSSEPAASSSSSHVSASSSTSSSAMDDDDDVLAMTPQPSSSSSSSSQGRDQPHMWSPMHIMPTDKQEMVRKR